MRLWLSKQNNGLYILSVFKPTQGNTLHKEDIICVIPGEPEGQKDLMSELLKTHCFEKELKEGESTQIELKGRIINDSTN